MEKNEKGEKRKKEVKYMETDNNFVNNNTHKKQKYNPKTTATNTEKAVKSMGKEEKRD